MAKRNQTSSKMPRPFGLTQMMGEYHHTKNPTILTSIQKFLINYWITNNMTLNNQSYTTNKFAALIGVDPDMIRTVMRDQLFNARMWDPESQKEMVQGLLGEQVTWLLEDRMHVNQQVESLKTSQGNTYKPFVSAELTRALKLQLETTGNLSQLLRVLTPNQTNNLQINIDQSQNQNNFITIEEARTLIQQTQAEQLLQEPNKEVHLLETTYDLAALPEVNALKQGDVDVSKEALNFNPVELSQITDDYKGAMKKVREDRHEIRREIEERIIEDAEDPELDIYDEDPEEVQDFAAANFLMPH